jgi:putative ABC transport system permease protein
MRFLNQLVAVITLTLRLIPQRAGSSAIALVGIGGVVIVFVAVLSIAEGFRAALVSAGSPDTAMVMRGGSDSELTSALTMGNTRVIKDAPGLRRSATGGGAAASAELFVVINLPLRSTGTDANVPLRGVQPAAVEVRDDVTITEGRRFRLGTNEIIVGRNAMEQYVGLEVGTQHRWGENEWSVVGIFESGGSIVESEIWCDASVLQPAYRRGDTFQTVFAKLESPESFEQFKDALMADPRLDVMVEPEGDYYAAQSRAIHGIITGLGTIIAVLMGIGAVFGAINTMYTAVASRTREIATLRALGFSGGPIVASVLVESLFLSLLGGLLGGTAAYLGFNGYQAATLNWQTFSQVAFAFAVTPALLAQGTAYAVVMGFLGGLFPAVRAARLPIVTALREL